MNLSKRVGLWFRNSARIMPWRVSKRNNLNKVTLSWINLQFCYAFRKSGLRSRDRRLLWFGPCRWINSYTNCLTVFPEQLKSPASRNHKDPHHQKKTGPQAESDSSCSHLRHILQIHLNNILPHIFISCPPQVSSFLEIPRRKCRMAITEAERADVTEM